MNAQTFVKQCPITFILLILCVLWFGVGAIAGVNIDNPSSADLVKYGANFLPLTMTDEPWRLLSSGFVHVGIMHLLFNCFALYFFGQSCEVIFGKMRFLGLFLLSVIGGNLLSLSVSWHHFLNNNADFVVSAGASGGIMGLGMALTALSLSPHKIARYLDKKQLIMIMAINFVIGFALAGIDNAAHTGGAVVGGILGFALGFTKKSWVYLGIFFALLAMLGVAWRILYQAILPYA